jgi:hypothetical protein
MTIFAVFLCLPCCPNPLLDWIWRWQEMVAGCWGFTRCPLCLVDCGRASFLVSSWPWTGSRSLAGGFSFQNFISVQWSLWIATQWNEGILWNTNIDLVPIIFLRAIDTPKWGHLSNKDTLVLSQGCPHFTCFTIVCLLTRCHLEALSYSHILTEL